MAAIDIGSNAMRLLVAERGPDDRLAVIEARRDSVRLGGATFHSGLLEETAILRAVDTLAAYRERMDALGVERYRAVATSAVRDSVNQDALIQAALRVADIEVEVISGEEEGQLIARAVRDRLGLGQGQWVLLDVGGGSVEVSVLDRHRLVSVRSLPLGALRLLDYLGRGTETVERLRQEVERRSARLTMTAHEVAGQPAPPVCVATGGNIKALAKLCPTTSVGPDGVAVVSVTALDDAIERLAPLSYAQRVSEMGLAEDRADVILPAAIVYREVARRMGATALLVPEVGVREGVASMLLERTEAQSRGRHALWLLQKNGGAEAIGDDVTDSPRIGPLAVKYGR